MSLPESDARTCNGANTPDFAVPGDDLGYPPGASTWQRGHGWTCYRSESSGACGSDGRWTADLVRAADADVIADLLNRRYDALLRIAHFPYDIVRTDAEELRAMKDYALETLNG